MFEALLFLFGVGVGAICIYFAMRNRLRREQHGVGAYVKRQQGEKQSRKEKILEIIHKKGSVTNNDIETALDVSDASVTNYLQELEHEGKIEQIGARGRFITYQARSK